MAVAGLKTVHKLRGIVCYPLFTAPPLRKQVCCSQSFGMATESLADVRAAVASFISIAAAKLRREGLLAGRLSVSISTDGWRDDQPRYANAVTFNSAPLSNCMLHLSHLALRPLATIQPR